MPRWVYLLLFVGFCVTAVHLVRGIRAVVRGQFQPVGVARQLTGWSTRWAGLLLIVPLFGAIGTGGQLGQWVGLSGDASELSAQLNEGWGKARAAKGDEPARQAAVKECSRAIQGLILAFGSDFTLFGVLCAVVVWVVAAVGGSPKSPSEVGAASGTAAGRAEQGAADGTMDVHAPTT
jgi:hypothetical protein